MAARFRAVLSLIELENSTRPYLLQDIASDASSIFPSFNLVTIKVTKSIARKCRLKSIPKMSLESLSVEIIAELREFSSVFKQKKTPLALHVKTCQFRN